MTENKIFDDFAGKEEQLTDEQYVDKLVEYVQEVLNRSFPECGPKRKIYRYKDRLNFACPLCGDSASDPYKKRGNIILRGKFANLYKCHNDCVYGAMPINKFFQKCNLSVDSSIRKKINETMVSKMNEQFSFDTSVSTADMLFYVDEIEEISIDRNVLKEALRLCECDGSDGNNKATVYLKRRLQHDYKKFLYDTEDDKLYILNLTPSGKIFGLQTRELNEYRANKYGKYKTYSITKLHEVFLKENLDENEDLKNMCSEYEQLSMVFGVLLVDYGKTVYATEGPMDSMIIKNCIALCGGSKNLDIGVELNFIYDSDAAGIKYAVDRLKEGKRVFMWKKYLKDNNLPERKKWDLNDLLLYCYENGKQMPQIYKYFTNDSFDVMML